LYYFVSTKLAGVSGIIKTTTTISAIVFKNDYDWIPPELQENDEELIEVESPDSVKT
jgi:hypothetical protein